MDAVQGRGQWSRRAAVNRQSGSVEHITKRLQDKDDTDAIHNNSKSPQKKKMKTMKEYLVQFNESLRICAFHRAREGELF